MGFFRLGTKKEKQCKSCCCCSTCTPSAIEHAEQEKREGGIKVLGGGCAKCHELEANARAALQALGIDEGIQLITDFAVIAAYGVMSTPALVVDEKVISYGKVLSPDEVLTLVKRERGLA